MKEVLCTDDNTIAWQAWNVAHDLPYPFGSSLLAQSISVQTLVGR